MSDDDKEVDVPEPSPSVTAAQAVDIAHVLWSLMYYFGNDDFAAIF